MTHPIITNETGLKALRINPYDTPQSRFGEAFCEFEANNPEYDLVEKALPNVELEGELVWQYLNPAFDGRWISLVYELKNSYCQTRQAWQVIPNKEETPEHTQEYLKELAKKFEHLPKEVMDGFVTEESFEEVGEFVDMIRSFISTHHLTAEWDRFI